MGVALEKILEDRAPGGEPLPGMNDDIPLRAALVATLVATVVTLSRWVGPTISGIIALFPVVYSSLMLILQPRIGGPATAAVIANGSWGLIGFAIAQVFYGPRSIFRLPGTGRRLWNDMHEDLLDRLRMRARVLASQGD